MNQLIVFLLAVLVTSLWCIGLHTVAVKLIIEEVMGTDIEMFWDGSPELPRWKKLIYKPLWACPACMASLWGTLIFWIVFPYMGILLWIPFCICLCGLNFVIGQFFVE